jgi:hypothetical protein
VFCAVIETTRQVLGMRPSLHDLAARVLDAEAEAEAWQIFADAASRIRLAVRLCSG